METSQLVISKKLWKKLVIDLKKRGYGKRESGAFLLGPKGTTRITEFICMDDLDPNCLDTGIIRFSGKGFPPLWKHCKQRDLKVHADVHTHPESWTGMSGADKQHPMIAQAGHIGLIIPSYAGNKNQLLNGVGIYRYLGDKKWEFFTGTDTVFKIKT